MDEYVSLNPNPAPTQTSTLAVVSLVSALLSYVLFPFIGAVIAVICGHMARNEIRASGGRLDGDGLAAAGLLLGYIHLGLTAVSVVCALAVTFLAFVLFLIALLSAATVDVQTLYRLLALV